MGGRYRTAGRQPQYLAPRSAHRPGRPGRSHDVGALALRRDGGAVLALDDGTCSTSTAAGSYIELVEVEHNRAAA